MTTPAMAFRGRPLESQEKAKAAMLQQGDLGRLRSIWRLRREFTDYPNGMTLRG